MHVRWDGIAPFGVRIGPAMVDVFDKLGLFRIFSASWFVLLLVVLVIAIVCCTLDRTPRLWRQSQPGRVDQQRRGIGQLALVAQFADQGLGGGTHAALR